MPAPQQTYAKNEVTNWPIPNYWDVVALVLVLTILFLLGWGAKAMLGHYQPGQTIPISLSPWELPYYALRTIIRMFIALGCSLVFTFTIATWAAKSKHAERVIIPMIDILQSVPILGFLSVAAVVFIALFKGSLLGPECAAIFAIFTAQVWNMALSFYQSVKTVPKALREAAAVFQLSAWQVFWRIEVPFAMPGLLWNAMMSMSSSWVFLVAAEAISVAHRHITLPGIGSYIDLAIQQRDVSAIVYVIITMLIVILAYDQIVFRPLVAWSEKFKMRQDISDEEPESWFLDLFQRTRFFCYVINGLSIAGSAIVNWRGFRRRSRYMAVRVTIQWRRWAAVIWNIVLIGILAVGATGLTRFVFDYLGWHDILHVVFLGSITALRVMILVVISSLIWVPIGVWIGLRPKVSQIAQPIAQIFAAFPANLLFPVVVILVVHYNLNVNIWLSPLMILGTQWYILFNVIAGTSALPRQLHQAVGTLNVRGWLWWKRFILPGIFPYYITGAITAAGGAWNISIIAEAVSWGKVHLYATGLGSYITQVANQAKFPELVLGIAVMALYVLAINRIIWRPLYQLAQERYQL